jgi:hypothetical protein
MERVSRVGQRAKEILEQVRSRDIPFQRRANRKMSVSLRLVVSVRLYTTEKRCRVCSSMAALALLQHICDLVMGFVDHNSNLK